MHRVRFDTASIKAEELDEMLGKTEHSTILAIPVKITKTISRYRVACVEGKALYRSEAVKSEEVTEYAKIIYVQAGRNAKLILNIRPYYGPSEPEIICSETVEYKTLTVEDKLYYNVSPTLIVTFDMSGMPDIDTSILHRILGKLYGGKRTGILDELIRPM